jgi:hypothetical protein
MIVGMSGGRGLCAKERPFLCGRRQVYGKYYRKITKASQDVVATANSCAEEALSSMATVRLLRRRTNEDARTKAPAGGRTRT